MVVTVFRSRLRAEHADEFQALAEQMLKLARSMPGFISHRVYVSEDGERASIVEFDSAETLEAWREHPKHQEAQQTGRERYYEEYSLEVCEPLRDIRFERSPA
ncbi:MAG: antibiotic biosynthesis monooxygenase [Myxococcota bacterium]